ncbi:MAG: YihY/virulence factor BrkB family protein [Leptolyngbyaceae bacterium]|nr:YihY/virulence factor BrkB family protein [Leptolyngbyaceae bacterium]
MRPIRAFRYLNFKVLKQVIQESGKQRLPSLASEMAYSDVLAMFPALIAILTVIGMLEIPQEQVEGLIRQWLQLAPEEVGKLIQGFLAQIQVPQGEGVVSISLLVAIWIASGAISVSMNAMDQIYQTSPNQIRPFWKAKLVSLLLTIASLSLVFIASFLVFISDLLLQFVLNRLQIPPFGFLTAWNLLRWLLALMILAFSFGVIYRYGPSHRVPGTPLIPGAIVAALLWAIISQLFRTYVAYFGNYSVTYGALSAGILLLLWLNFSSLAMLIGAQLNVILGQVMREDQLRETARSRSTSAP